jgi:GTP cyclohydrolase II
LTQLSKPDLNVLTRVPLPAHLPVVELTQTPLAQAEIASFGPDIDGEHVAVLLGDWMGQDAPLVRIHSECLTGDVFGSARCDCGPQLREALALMAAEGGIVLYLRQEGRGIGLYNKLDAYRLQDRGLDTYEANRALNRAEDERDFGVAAAMLLALGVRKCRLLTNNPQKHRQLQERGIEVVERQATGVYVSGANRTYLEAKVAHAHHDMVMPSVMSATEINEETT